MNRRGTGANRAALTLLGAVLVLGAVAGLALSFGVRHVSSYQFAGPRPGQPVLPQQVRAFAAGTSWFWWAVAAGCLLLAFTGLRWLAAQLRNDRISRLDLTDDNQDGLTLLHAGALADAVAGDAQTIHGVTDASAHLSSHPTRCVVLNVDLADYADIALVRSHLETVTVARTRDTVGDPDLPIEIRLRPSATTRAALR